MKGNKSYGWRGLGIALVALLALPAIAQAQSWVALTHPAPFNPNDMEQLTDGRILVQQYSPSSGVDEYWALAPDSTGSYVNGTWTQVASLPSGYSPLYHTSQVLADGRVVVAGGEYNFLSADWTKLAAIYDPVANTWASLAAPTFFANIGDAQSVMLPNGTMMMANSVANQDAILSAPPILPPTWTSTGTGKQDNNNDEEGWNLLPDGSVLTVDTPTAFGNDGERWVNGVWSSDGMSPVNLINRGEGQEEIGPALLLPTNGTVFYIGGAGPNAIYTPIANSVGTWAAGPTFPNQGGQLGVADGPAAVLPDGDVLVGASPGIFSTPTVFFDFNPTTGSLTGVTAPPSANTEACYNGRMLVLPTGQIMYTNLLNSNSGAAYIYTDPGVSKHAWAPVVKKFPATVTHGSVNNVIKGTQFNGLTSGCSYGDDAQCSTAFPLVRITVGAVVTYCRTHNHSTMGIATGTEHVSTEFDAPATLPIGAGTLEVVANGISSKPVNITVN